MSDAEPSFGPTVVPRPIALATGAVVAVGVAALGIVAGSLAPLLAAVSGASLSAALRRMSREPLSLRDSLRGVVTLMAATAFGTLSTLAATTTPNPTASLGLAGALWLATLTGSGTGRDTLSPTALSRGWTSAGVALVGLALAIPFAGAALATLAAFDWLLGLGASGPALGTLLTLCGGACLLVGHVLRSAPDDVDARRPINRQLRSRAADAVTIGAWLLGGGVVAGIVGSALGGYDLLLSVAPPVWLALALVTSSALVRAVPLAVAALAVLAWIARVGTAWPWDEDGLDAARAGALLSPVAGAGALFATLVAASVASAIPGLASLSGGTAAVVDAEAITASFFVVLLGTATVLFAFRGTIAERRSGTPPALRLCILGLLVGAVIVALRGTSVVAPLVAVAAASIVWDVGRIGGGMGVELGEAADVRRGALVRVGGSAAVGALATVAAVALASVAERAGRLFAGPVVLALSAAVALVVVLSWYARKRDRA